MMRKVVLAGVVVLASLGGWQGATAAEAPVPSDADHVEQCVADERGRPFACVRVERTAGDYRAVEVCVREPRHGRAVVTPRWACAQSQDAVAPVEDVMRQVDAAFCTSEPQIGCTDYDETKSDVMLLVDAVEDRAFRTLGDPASG